MFKELSFQRVDRRRTCGGDPDFNIILVIFWSLDPLTWFEKKFNFQEWNFCEILLVFARIRPSIEWDPSARLVDGESFVWSKASGVIISWPTATHLRQGQSQKYRKFDKTTLSMKELCLLLGRSLLLLCDMMGVLIITSIFCVTRPKPAYGRQGLDWISGPGYSFVVFSTNKTMGTNQKPW